MLWPIEEEITSDDLSLLPLYSSGVFHQINPRRSHKEERFPEQRQGQERIEAESGEAIYHH